MQHLPDSVSLAPEPQAVLDRVIQEFEEHQHVREAAPRIVVLFSERPLFVHGGPAAAFICAPRWQGPTANVVAFLVAQLCQPVLDWEDPDYLVVVDAAIWKALDAERQERLMSHEAAHLVAQEDEWGVERRSKETGKPLLKLRPHDFEIFASEICRYGVETCDVVPLAQAIVEGEAQKRRRKLKIA